MLASAPLRSAQMFGWLPYLKAVQLQRIARATGIQSSGTKGVLVERIEGVLGRHYEEGRQLRGGDSTSSSGSINEHGEKYGKGKCSVLSIDMGIRNLAFAHFHLAQHPSATSQANTIPQLTAWRRLAVSEMGDKSLHGPVMTDTIEKTLKDDDVIVPTSRRQTQGTGEDSFSPSGYASMAYNLITSLLDTYRPTHILIERQRFRSGGGSAVQEWTLRVGIFEGMLYAILHALRHERGGETARISVQGIEPKRVVRYWMDKDEIPTENELGTGNSSARAVKKAKIDLVGRWLEASTGGGQGMISLKPDGEASEIASTYLRKLTTPNTRKKDLGIADVGKLDDLADCLLQGVTWMEWQKMRGDVVVKETATMESLLGQDEWERAQSKLADVD